MACDSISGRDDFRLARDSGTTRQDAEAFSPFRACWSTGSESWGVGLNAEAVRMYFICFLCFFCQRAYRP